MARLRCDHCRFWDDNEDGSGECRRRSPIVTGQSEGEASRLFANWPNTLGADWCGEFRKALWVIQMEADEEAQAAAVKLEMEEHDAYLDRVNELPEEPFPELPE